MVVAIWNPSEGSDREGIERELLRQSSDRGTRWRISRSTFVVGPAISNGI